MHTWVQALASHTNGVYTGLGYIFEDRGEILEVKGELVSSDRLPVDPTQACEASSLTVGGISRACRRVLQRHVCTGGVGRHLHRPRVAADDHVGEGGQAGVPAALKALAIDMRLGSDRLHLKCWTHLSAAVQKPL